MEVILEFMMGLFSWARSTQMCSPMSQTMLFTIIVSSLSILACGIYVWKRFIRSKPASEIAKEKPLNNFVCGEERNQVSVV